MADINFTPESGDIGFQPDSGVSSGSTDATGSDFGAGRTFGGSLNESTPGLESNQDGLSKGVSSIGDKMSDVAGRVSANPVVGSVVNRASAALDSSTDYVRTTSITDMRDDLTEQIRSHPLLSMGVAIGAGYILSKILD